MTESKRIIGIGTDKKALLKRGADFVFDKELAAVERVRPGDTVIAQEVTPLLKSLAAEHGVTVRELASVPAGLTAEQRSNVERMTAENQSVEKIAKYLGLDDDETANVKKVVSSMNNEFQKVYR